MTTYFHVGDRVRLTEEIEHFPLGIWPVGETGTIASIRDNLNGETGHTYYVKLDRHDPVLAEWRNELQIDAPGTPPFVVIAPDAPETIDDLIEVYADWNREQGLKLGSADEHLFDESLTAEQHKWLHQFCNRWELADTEEREREAIERRFQEEEASR